MLHFCKDSCSHFEAPNLDEFEKALRCLDAQSLVLFDVDETLIISKDLILRPCVRNLWNEYAQESLKDPKAILKTNDDLLAQVLWNIEYEIVDPKIVSIIHSLQKKKIKTIAFTRMNTGTFGVIPSMEDWRIAQLGKLNIDFCEAFPQFEEVHIPALEISERTSLFKQGVLFANKQDKGPVLIAFLKMIKWIPSKVVFIDNRLDYLQSVELALQGTGIEFIGFHYTEVERRPCRIKENLAKFQVMHLARTGIWMSDSKALEYLSNEEIQ